MSDLISRSALIKRRRKVVEYDEAGFSMEYNAVPTEVIKNAPTVEAKTVTDTNVGCKWIPVTERLPECEWGYETDELMFQVDSGSIEVGYYGTGGKFRNRYFRTYRDCYEGFDVKNVVAWMPLPNAYIAEQGGKNE